MTTTTTRRRYGLEALLEERPEELRCWVNDAPLKLVAAALIDIGGMAKKGAIIEKLPRELFDGSIKADPWWERVRPAVAESNFFKVNKNKKNIITEIGLRPFTKVDDIPAEPLPPKPAKPVKKKPATLTDWRKWLQSDVAEAPPGIFPTKAVSNTLTKWPTKTLDHAMDRLIWGAKAFLVSDRPTAQPAAGWMEALRSASLRWRECSGQASDSDLSAVVGELLSRLADIAGHNDESGDRLISASGLDGKSNPWRQGFMAGVWATIEGFGDGSRNLLNAMSNQLGREGEAYLVREVALTALDSDDLPRRHGDMDRLLGVLPASQRYQVIRELIIHSTGRPSADGLLEYLANSRYLTGLDRSDERLNVLALATICLANGDGTVASLASREFADAFKFPKEDSSAVQALFQDIRVENEELRARIAGELDEQRKAYEEKLVRESQEQDRLRQQNQTFRALMASGREESRLEVRWGMLLAAGDVLQRAYQQGDTPEARLQAVTTSLPNILREAGAEPFGIVGETVHYDSKYHHTTVDVPNGAMVCLQAPGVIVRGGSLGERVILKASVRVQSEVGYASRRN